MAELTSQQIATLERLVASGFTLCAFPMYATAVGVRKGDCAVLLDPIPTGNFRILGAPCVLLEGNLTVRIQQQGRSWFVWKKQRLAATPEKLAELDRFTTELKFQLEPHA